MTKKEFLVAEIAKKADMPANVAATVFNATVEVLVEKIAEGELKVDGLGTFKVATRAARVGKNPLTGETINIPAKKTVTFKPANSLKDKVN